MNHKDLTNFRVPLPINNKYKTRNCDKYTKNGICPYGQRCLFIHPDLDSLKQVTASPASSQQLRQQMPFEAIENKMHGTTTLSMPNRTLFAASLPMSMSQCHYQRSMAGRNLFPHVSEWRINWEYVPNSCIIYFKNSKNLFKRIFKIDISLFILFRFWSVCI